MAQKKHEKTPELIASIRAYANLGTPIKEIAILTKLADKTISKYYAAEIAEGHAQSKVLVTRKLMTLVNKENLGAICFWLKCQGGWRETSVIQNQTLGADGNPIDPVVPQLGISFGDGGPGLPRVKRGKPDPKDAPGDLNDRDGVYVTQPQETDPDPGEVTTH